MRKLQRLVLNHKDGTSEFIIKDENAPAFDEAQAKTEEEQAQARANIGAASAEEVGDIETALDSIIAIQEELLGVITFTVDGTSYKAISGMTWNEWIDSDWNTDEVQIDNEGYVSLLSGDMVGDVTGPVQPTEKINNGYDYMLW